MSPSATTSTGVSVVVAPPSPMSWRQYDSMSLRPTTAAPPGGSDRAFSAYSTERAAASPALYALVQAAVGSDADSAPGCEVCPHAVAATANDTAMIPGM